MPANTETMFGFMSGSWHNIACWDELRRYLYERGYDSQAVEMPNDALSDFDSYADVAQYEFSLPGFDYVVVGHSRAANVVPRVAARIRARHQVYLCPSFEYGTLKPLLPEGLVLPPKYHPDYLYTLANGALEYDDIYPELTCISPTAAQKFLYQECSLAAQRVVSQWLRPTRRSRQEPELTSWPEGSRSIIYGNKDRAISPEWTRFVGRELLKTEPIELDADHSPFISRTAELGKLLIPFAAPDLVLLEP